MNMDLSKFLSRSVKTDFSQGFVTIELMKKLVSLLDGETI